MPTIVVTNAIFRSKFSRNPAGLAILCTFKYGSIGMGLEAYRYGDLLWHPYSYLKCEIDVGTDAKCIWVSACNVKWVGLRRDDLHLVPEQALIPLKPRDLQIAKSLMSSEVLQVEPSVLDCRS